MFVYDPAGAAWAGLSAAAGGAPSPRDRHGFASWGHWGGALYVHCGQDKTGGPDARPPTPAVSLDN